MEQTAPKRKLGLHFEIEPVVRLIADTVRPTGEIPWCEGQKTDPWDLVEAIMGLNIGGRSALARSAFRWLAQMQHEEGSWCSAYQCGLPEDETRDTNMASYIAVGLLHHHLINGDIDFIREMWPTIERAIDFSINLQAPGGEIHWAISPEGILDPMALLTGSSSVYMSLKCALTLARLLDQSKPLWVEARNKLGDAILRRPHLFNMAKARFSMDWFYPVLSGALTGADAQRRIEKSWNKYVIKGHGVLCVSDQPWVTIAETSELVLALHAMGAHARAETVFSWIQDKRFDDGSFWCGYTHPDLVIWPEDKITWTNAVVLMAADALYGLTPAAGLFNHSSWTAGGDFKSL
jgi:hypothetical protein